jgi:ferritin-like metal-binding protein YciE
MFERLNTPQEVFRWDLGAALTMERDIVEMLDDLIETSHGEDLKQALRSHQAETRGHVTNIEQAFHALEWDVDDSPCPVIEAIGKEGKSKIRKSDDAIVDSIVLAGAIETEHHEIAVYENLLIHARVMANGEVVQLLERNLEDEQRALQTVKGLAQQVATAGPRQMA